jgi:hypothetical protein
MARTAGILDNFDASHECSEITCLYHGSNWWLERLIESDQDPKALGADRPEPDYFL